MELPRALIPWGAYLDLFPRELAAALGPLIQRLDLGIGPLRVHGRHGEGDPDGFRGIARKGPYERLLISEWMLAEEFPEEFARRAAMREQGFLELARREPAGARTSIALFDAGPNQMGAPRLAHLAALIVLARRAEAAGACFQWGVLQQPVETLHTSVTASMVLHLLLARSSREATDADVAAWREQAGSQIGADDLWIVGGRRLRAFPAVRGASLLQIDDPLEPEARRLVAEVMDKGRANPAITLELPEDALCVRLLRDPFLIRTAAPHRAISRFVTPTSPLRFAAGGTRLMARSGPEHVVVYPIPNSPHGTPGNPKVYHANSMRPILAADHTGKGIALVTAGQDSDVLHIERVGPKSGRFHTITFLLPPGMKVAMPRSADPLPPCFYLQYARPEDRWLVLVGGCLLRPPINENETEVPYAAVEMENVQAAAMTAQSCVFLGKDKTTWTLRLFPSEGTENVDREFDTVLQAHIGYGGALMDPRYGMVAIEETAEQWTVLYKNGFLTMPVPFRYGDVLGVVALAGEGIAGMEGSTFEPGLIVLTGPRQIAVLGRNWWRDLPPASADIAQITASPYGPNIAYLTILGELVVYSLAQQVVLYRLETRVAP